MEFIDGIKISDVAALRRAHVDTSQVMQTLIEAYCEQVLVHGFFHADPHPGNLFVQPPTGPGSKARVVFVDFGLAKDLPPTFRKGVVELVGSLLQGNSDAMAQALVDLGFETRTGDLESLEEITRIVLEVATKFRHQSFVDPELAREAGEELPRLVRENPIVRMPTHVVLLGRVIGLLSGLGRTLGGQLDMLKIILPYALGGQSARKP
jgi:predicted unusual protein kinase regulating ubiquinone biosynthesis (AarF/ABC1/UbiB family)